MFTAIAATQPARLMRLSKRSATSAEEQVKSHSRRVSFKWPRRVPPVGDKERKSRTRAEPAKAGAVRIVKALLALIFPQAWKVETSFVCPDGGIKT